MIQNFYIKKGSELPTLLMKTTDYNYFKYSDFYSEINSADIFFYMKGVDDEYYTINKKRGSVQPILPDCVDCTDEQQGFYVKYEFSKKDTSKTGIYKGEFKIIFKGDVIPELKGEMILPIRNTLYINII